MAEELVTMCSNLNIEDDTEGIVELGDSSATNVNDKVTLMLIGRLLTTRSINMEAFRRTMTQVWNLQGKVIIRVIDTNLFVFQLFHWRDKEKILEGGPWCFDQQLLILNSITGDEQPNQVPLNHSPFWVRIYNLPFNCRTNEDVKAITASMGNIIELEEDDFGLDRYRRVKLLIDVNKPLRRNQHIRNKCGDVVRIDFKYERLPFFCFHCGILGHSEKDCNHVSEDLIEKGYGWGLWIKASPRKGRKREKEEVQEVCATRKNLFVCKTPSGEVSGSVGEKESREDSQPKAVEEVVPRSTRGIMPRKDATVVSPQSSSVLSVGVATAPKSGKHKLPNKRLVGGKKSGGNDGGTISNMVTSDKRKMGEDMLIDDEKDGGEYGAKKHKTVHVIEGGAWSELHPQFNLVTGPMLDEGSVDVQVAEVGVNQPREQQ